jgi:hypothetical protein
MGAQCGTLEPKKEPRQRSAGAHQFEEDTTMRTLGDAAHNLYIGRFCRIFRAQEGRNSADMGCEFAHDPSRPVGSFLDNTACQRAAGSRRITGSAV